MINTHCQGSADSTHGFTQISAGTRDSTSMPFHPYMFHTCITCGHRRCIDTDGVLWYYDMESKEWLMKLDEENDSEVKKIDLRASIETAEQIWAIYSAPSRSESGGKMFDFDKWLPGQIDDWKRQLEGLEESGK